MQPPTERPVPTATDAEHLYEVKLVVVAPAGSSPDAVLSHVMAGVLLKENMPLSVVVGYGASVKILTDTRGMQRTGAMYCTSFVNKSVGKRKTVPVMDPPKRAKKASKR